MSIAKKFALIGVIVAVVVAVINFIVALGTMVNLWSEYSKDGAGFSLMIAAAAIFILAFGVAITILKIIAFRRLDTPKEKGWRVLILILGIISLLSSIPSVISFDMLNAFLELVQAVCFILAFVFGRKKIL